jgi:hypothetical protein
MLSKYVMETEKHATTQPIFLHTDFLIWRLKNQNNLHFKTDRVYHKRDHVIFLGDHVADTILLFFAPVGDKLKTPVLCA